MHKNKDPIDKFGGLSGPFATKSKRGLRPSFANDTKSRTRYLKTCGSLSRSSTSRLRSRHVAFCPNENEQTGGRSISRQISIALWPWPSFRWKAG